MVAIRRVEGNTDQLVQQRASERAKCERERARRMHFPNAIGGVGTVSEWQEGGEGRSSPSNHHLGHESNKYFTTIALASVLGLFHRLLDRVHSDLVRAHDINPTCRGWVRAKTLHCSGEELKLKSTYRPLSEVPARDKHHPSLRKENAA